MVERAGLEKISLFGQWYDQTENQGNKNAGHQLPDLIEYQDGVTTEF